MKITLKNFRCYKHATFEFGKGLVLISGPSGEGKSTILMAIHFALFGSGNKLASYGHTSCEVQLEFDDMKIIRSKRPNRLIVNEIYEDQIAQDIINTKFGDTFDVCGYISQNALNSFILMSPLDKLSFLEKFAFKDIDLGQIKGKCKALINKRYDTMISSISQTELAVNILKEMIIPEEVIFPIKCSVKQQDKVYSNEKIKFKNCNILKKRSNKKIQVYQKEVNDLKLLENTICIKKDIIQSTHDKINLLSDEKNTITYDGDEQLNEYKIRLKNIISKNKILSLENTYQTDINKLNNMKEDEITGINKKIDDISSKLWKEYNKDEVIDMIENNKICLGDMEHVVKLEKELKKYENISEEDIHNKNKELNEYRNQLELKKQHIDKVDVQKKIYSCPCCNVKLKIKDEKLFLINNSINVLEENIVNNIKNEIIVLSNNIKNLEKLITDSRKKLDRKNDIHNDIKNILSQYNDIKNDISSIRDDLEYIQDYKHKQMSLEEKLSDLKLSLNNENFSTSYNTFKINVLKQENEIKLLKGKLIVVQEESLTENELINLINKQENSKERLNNVNNSISSLEIEIKKHQCDLDTIIKNHKETYGQVKNIYDIDELILIEKSNLEKIEEDEIKYNNNIQIIEKYMKYKTELDNYKNWENKIKLFKETEKKERDMYSAAMTLKEKIIEAESISMCNIISSINTHAQMYLDYFFVDNPIVVKLLTFKESKKNVKPQINIDIDYKDMKCDLYTLSGGELSRVILAFTLALADIFNTPMLLLDECTASLDQELTSIVFSAIRDNFNGKLILIIAHQVVNGLFDKTIQISNKDI